MRKTKRKVISILLTFAMLLAMMPAGTFAEDSKPSYVALGDSITTGHRLEGYEAGGTTPSNAFPRLLADALDYELTNLAVDGNTAAGILEQLADENVQEAVAGADLITITAGGNDLMHALYDAIADDYNKSNGTTYTGNDVITAFSPNPENTTMSFDGVKMIAALEIIDVFSESDAFSDALVKYCTAMFGETGVIKTIKNLNSNVVIIMNTQYNPYKSFSGGGFMEVLYTGIEPGAVALNEEISSTANGANSTYIVADVYKTFAGVTETLCNATAYPLDLDFHPNADGHALIFDTIKNALPNYTITFNGNGGTVTPASAQTDIKGNLAALPEPSYPGYNFVGWFDAETGGTEVTISTKFTKNTTIYAQWTPQALTGTVTITGDMQFGSTLTADVTDSNNTGDLSYQWYRQSGGTETEISGATEKTYTLTADDIGCNISCIVKSSKQTDNISGAATGTVVRANFDSDDISIDDYEGTYDSHSHSIHVKKLPEDATIEYSIDDGTNYVEELPEYRDAGTYTITYAISKTGYQTVTGTATVTINKAPLTITADNLSKTYGEADPALTWKLTEGSMQGNDALEKISISRATGENAGSYQITVTQEDNANSNYDITFETGAFTIDKAQPNYTVPTNLIAYTSQTLADVNLPNGFSWEDPDTTPVGDIGNQTFEVTFTPDDTDNYEIVTNISVTIAVSEAPCIIDVSFDNFWGQVIGSGSFKKGETAKLMAIPEEGLQFAYWLDTSVALSDNPTAEELENAIVSYDAEYTFTVTENRSLEAVFSSPMDIQVRAKAVKGTDEKDLLAGEELVYDIPPIAVGHEQITLPGDVMDDIITVGGVQYQFVGFIFEEYDDESETVTARLEKTLTIDAEPLYKSAEWLDWMVPYSDGVVAGYVTYTPSTPVPPVEPQDPEPTPTPTPPEEPQDPEPTPTPPEEPGEPQAPEEPVVPDEPEEQDEPIIPEEAEKPDEPKDEGETPDTGDKNNLAVWMFLLILCSGMGIGATVYSRKRKDF